MRITAILGSPRSGGNTDLLAAKVLEGAAAAGWATETCALRKMTIRPCTGCGRCWKLERPCVLEDDMDGLYEALAQTDALLLATPVYWYAPTALMKSFMDRLVPFNRPQGRPLIRGKRAIGVIAYEEQGPTAAEPLVRTLELSFEYLELRQVGMVVVDGVGEKGAVLDRPEALQAAYEVGKRLGGEAPA